MRFFQKHTYFPIILLGVVIRILYVFCMGEDLLAGDAGYYVDTASKIASGLPFYPEWPPGLPYYLAGFIRVFGGSLWVLASAMWILYVLLCLCWIEIAEQFMELRHVKWGLWIFACMPACIHYSTAPLSQLPVAIFVLAWVYLLIKGDKGWKIGLCLALAILIRPGSLILFPLVVVYLIYQKQASKLPGLLLLMALLIGSWQYKSYHMTDRVVWINDFNSFNVFVGNHVCTPDYKTWWLGSHDERGNDLFDAYYTDRDSIYALPKEKRSLAFTQKAQEYVAESPGIFLLRCVNRVRVFFAFDTYTGATLISKNRFLGIATLLLDGGIFVLLGLGFVLSINNKASPISLSHQFLIGALGLGYGIPYFLAFSHPTYHFPLIPLFALLTLAYLSKSALNISLFPRGFIRRGMLLFFLLIQLEWIWRMSDNV